MQRESSRRSKRSTWISSEMARPCGVSGARTAELDRVRREDGMEWARGRTGGRQSHPFSVKRDCSRFHHSSETVPGVVTPAAATMSTAKSAIPSHLFRIPA
ncbi:hypothetical protein BT93_L4066 [Corymbia citriodora subsp. variegata]|uniref:Uncharacterized protein n=1 Tax=Corymbia citriodora subsp. variegata TaxID=360336 RepID=A0A8T0CGA7_CORYI|nr:hypothetical protein BT93_L4066 [Corymbia citriodora subsp. variegata]